MAEKMLGVLAANGSERILVVYGHDGLDELTTTDTSTVSGYLDVVGTNFTGYDIYNGGTGAVGPCGGPRRGRHRGGGPGHGRARGARRR